MPQGDKAGGRDQYQPGLVFNIQKYSVHDGPGIRTIVFLKGCPLACAWCSNPESQAPHPELACNPDKCLTPAECTRCLDLCPRKALSPDGKGRMARDPELCDDCLLCASACPSQALSVYGYEVTVEQALRRVEDDEAFYARSGGGLTLSGGEPLMQPGFTLALLRQAKARHLDTCLETCGQAPWPVLEQAAPYLNSIFYDLKCLDERRHQQGTGASNQLILSNLRRLREAFPNLPLVVRTPVVPGFNDQEEVIAQMADLVGSLPGAQYQLLAYHRMGTPKYAYLGRAYHPREEAGLAPERFQHLQALAARRLGRAQGREPGAPGEKE